VNRDTNTQSFSLADEEIRLEAGWDEPANGFRLKSVPIHLAAVPRAIDSELANHISVPPISTTPAGPRETPKK